MSNPFFAPWSTPYGVPPFAAIETAHFRPAYEAALAEHRRAVTSSVALDLGCPALFTADGCVLMSDGADRLTPPPRRMLAPYEAKPLIGHSGRTLVRGFG